MLRSKLKMLQYPRSRCRPRELAHRDRTCRSPGSGSRGVPRGNDNEDIFSTSTSTQYPTSRRCRLPVCLRYRNTTLSIRVPKPLKNIWLLMAVYPEVFKVRFVRLTEVNPAVNAVYGSPARYVRQTGTLGKRHKRFICLPEPCSSVTSVTYKSINIVRDTRLTRFRSTCLPRRRALATPSLPGGQWEKRVLCQNRPPAYSRKRSASAGPK